ncbi:ester cyclase [Neorhizobium sp. BETTINA12A]|uniref:ester cyclase n=1 Tax=Neorhizobium sp. BETTINA12A TaxID=2908924 RepID=UPI001FF63AA8|nr:ester cyclase [Neorhizobium sp. BETTINA12A]MCJ9753952.1 ester cyclase [Neorhizobium sp. BETTINA12A]
MQDQAKTNKTIVRGYIEEIWNRGLIERFGSFFAAEYQEAAYSPANSEGHCAMVAVQKRIMPDAVWTIERMAAEDDGVMCELTLCGTHQAAFKGVEPSGNPIRVRAYRSFVLKDGKIMHHSALLDTAELLKQMRGQQVA